MAIVVVTPSRRTALVAGVFVLSGILLLAVVVALQLGQFAARITYFADFTYVAGLQTGAEVQVAGFPIGTVAGITPRIVYPTPSFRVQLSIDPAWRIPRGSKAKITSTGLIGGQIVDLELAPAPDPAPDEVFLAAGDVIETTRDIPIAEQAENVLQRVNRFFSEDLQGPVKNLAQLITDLNTRSSDLFSKNLNPATDTFNTAMTALNKTLSEDLPQLLATLQNRANELDPILKNAQYGTQQLGAFAADVANAENAALIEAVLRNVGRSLEQVQATTASANRLLREMAPNLATAATDAQFSMQVLSQSLAGVLQDLDRAAGDLAGLARDLRRNPAIIFGR